MSCKFEIVTDSSANLTNGIIDRYGIHILSLVFRVDEQDFQSYIKGEENDLQRFYVMMREGKAITTSCVNPEVARAGIEPLLKDGRDVLYLGFSSGLSATYQTVCSVIEELRQAYPARMIMTVDTLSASLGEGLLVTYAARMRDEGKSIMEVRDFAEENKLNLCHWFTVDDLQYLKRGGRISAAAAFIGGLLNIKPVLHVDNEGHLISVAKVRGIKKALDALVDHMDQTCFRDMKQLVYISHADYPEGAEYVANKVREKFDVEDIVIHQVDPVIGAHSGPGTVALFFLGSER
ncbi:MAG: DegV family protein [Christensenellales bacterium]